MMGNDQGAEGRVFNYSKTTQKVPLFKAPGHNRRYDNMRFLPILKLYFLREYVTLS